MAKKKAATTAPKSKAAPKAAQSAAAKVKSEISANVKAKAAKKATPAKPKVKVPKWLLPYPVDYVVGTEDYVKLIEEFNKRFATGYNPFRVRPAVFYTIHEDMWNHYDPEQYKENLRRG